MVIETIASAAIPLGIIFLTKAAEDASSQVLKSLWTAIKKPFTSDKDRAIIKELEKNPSDLRLQGKAEAKLESFIEANPEIAEELEKLISEAKKQGDIIIKNNVNGSITTTAGTVIVGDNNKVSTT